MARIRTLKPEFWSDEKLGPLDPITRLVFLGLISHADDAGRLIDSVRQIDGLLFPYSDNDSSRESLETLARLSRIVRYESEAGQRLIQIAGWSAHQRVDRPSRYVLPGPAPETQAARGIPDDPRNPREGLASVSREIIAPTMDLGASTTDLGPASLRARAREAELPSPDDPVAGMKPLTAQTLRGLYGGPGREGTDERVWGELTDERVRETLLATAVLRWQGEDHARFNQRLFRAILLAVVADYLDGGPSGNGGTAPGEDLWLASIRAREELTA